MGQTTMSEETMAVFVEKPPKNTQYAVWLLYPAALITLVTTYYSVTKEIEDLLVAIMAGALIAVSFLYWTYFKIWQGRNWARIFVTVTTFLGVLSIVIVPSAISEMGTFIVGAVFLKYCMYFVALSLLYTKSSNEYFKRVKEKALK